MLLKLTRGSPRRLWGCPITGAITQAWPRSGHHAKGPHLLLSAQPGDPSKLPLVPKGPGHYPESQEVPCLHHPLPRRPSLAQATVGSSRNGHPGGHRARCPGSSGPGNRFCPLHGGPCPGEKPPLCLARRSTNPGGRATRHRRLWAPAGHPQCGPQGRLACLHPRSFWVITSETTVLSQTRDGGWRSQGPLSPQAKCWMRCPVPGARLSAWPLVSSTSDLSLAPQKAESARVLPRVIAKLRLVGVLSAPSLTRARGPPALAPRPAAQPEAQLQGPGDSMFAFSVSGPVSC